MEIPDLTVEVLEHPDQVGEFMDWIRKPGRWYIACDVETTGLNQFAPGFHTRLIQFGDSSGGWAVPFQQWKALVQWVFEWCSRARVQMVWHNLVYDAQALAVEKFGLDFTIQADTFVLASLGGYAEQSRGLKQLGIKELGQWAGFGQDVLKTGMKNAGWTWETVPIGWKPFGVYGIMDVCITALLWEKWQPRYKRWREMHDLEIATIDVVNAMARRGMPVDIPYLTKKQQELTVTRDALGAEFKAQFGFMPSMRQQLGKLLSEAGVVPDDAPMTTTGVSTAKEVLSRIDHPAAKMALAYNSTELVLSRYINKLIEFADSDNLVHAGIQPMQAKTSRMSIERPALQQLPNEDISAVRRGVIGYHGGEWDLISSDFSQIELRLWASNGLNGDQALMAAIKEADTNGPDFFTALCRSIYGEPDFQKKDPRRTSVKSSVYAKLFGGGIKIAAETAGVTVASMVPAWSQLGKAFPSMKDAGAGMIKRHGKAAYIMSPFDRRFAALDEKFHHTLPSWVTQGSAAIAFKIALLGCSAAGLDEYMVLPVHDELVLSTPKHMTLEVMAEVKEVMNSVVTEEEYGINVPAEPQSGKSWDLIH